MKHLRLFEEFIFSSTPLMANTPLRNGMNLMVKGNDIIEVKEPRKGMFSKIFKNDNVVVSCVNNEWAVKLLDTYTNGFNGRRDMYGGIKTDGNDIRKEKRPNDLFLDFFQGERIATCANKRSAKAFVDAYNGTR